MRILSEAIFYTPSWGAMRNHVFNKPMGINMLAIRDALFHLRQAIFQRPTDRLWNLSPRFFSKNPGKM